EGLFFFRTAWGSRQRSRSAAGQRRHGFRAGGTQPNNPLPFGTTGLPERVGRASAHGPGAGDTRASAVVWWSALRGAHPRTISARRQEPRLALARPSWRLLAHREKRKMRFGHFDDENKEYVITTPKTPYPWINYLGSEEFFGLVSNQAGGYCFYRDAKLRRLTRYRYNNVPTD